MEDWIKRLSILVSSFLLLAGFALSQENTTLRLAGGSTDYGRLEIYLNGEWGTVCDDSFSDLGAKVACRQLGLGTYQATYYSSAHFGEGYGPIWLDEVMCDGYESTLLNCQRNSIGLNDCSHSEDVGISCGRSSVPGSSGSGTFFNGVGGWIGFAVVIMLISIGVTIWRRHRIAMYRRNHHTTTTTVVAAATVPNNPGNTGMPTYYHGAQQPGGAPAPAPPAGPIAATGPGGYPAQPGGYPTQQQAYPQQPYPPAANPGGYAYPPPASGAPPAAPYTDQPYPPVQQPGAVPYPPQQQSDQPPMYPPQTGATDENLPPPPSYTDIVKQ